MSLRSTLRMLAPRCMAGLSIVSTFAAAEASDLRAQDAPAVPFPDFKASAFRGGPVDNPFLPLAPGAVYVFRIHEGNAITLDSITVMRETRRVAGVTATVVHDRVTRGNQPVEDTYDWYAQDTTGTVWYLGEDTKEYKAGKVSSTAGSWEAGVAGARAGIMMPAHPRPGEPYRQEYRKGVAEDMARIVNLNDSVTVAAGHFTGCLTTEDWSAIEPGVRERKTYCPRVGLVRERPVSGGGEWMELVSMSKR